MPAVSIKSTGPSGNSSIGFSAGSVVVPAMSDTIETFCPVRAFKMLDLPTLRRPKIPMWQRRLFGVFCMGCISFVNYRRSEPANGLGGDQRVVLGLGKQVAFAGRLP